MSITEFSCVAVGLPFMQTVIKIDFIIIANSNIKGYETIGLYAGSMYVINEMSFYLRFDSGWCSLPAEK